MTLEFNEEEHTYFKDGQPLRSVTRWLDSFFPVFDADEKRWDGKTWAQATAEYVREEIRGEGPVTKKYPDPFHYSKRLFGDDWQREVDERSKLKVPINARGVKKYWELKGLKAAEDGSEVHRLIEQCIQGEQEVLLQDDQRVIAAINFLERLKALYKWAKIFTEKQLGSLDLLLAGTVDCIIETENGIVIVDWKTNESLEGSYGDITLVPDTDPLPNGKLTRYTLQLSAYAYLLETLEGKTIKALYICHLTQDGYKEYKVEYKKELIEEMLKHEHE